MNNIKLIIEKLKNDIANELVNRVQDSYSKQSFSTLFITDAEKIASAEIAKCKKENFISTEHLINILDTCYNNLDNTLVNQAIYETDYQMKTLEDDKTHFFVRESLLSNDSNYNSRLYKKVIKAKMLSAEYVPAPDKGIYIFKKDIKVLDLSTGLGKCIDTLDLRRLRDCPNLAIIKLGKHLKYTHLEEISTKLSTVRVDY
ncbi:hypothetical protein DVV95_11150 [Clostridium botulinum]|uniref:hypothetical protein n=1 Tax=Clostridium botulinum TaxID=1491 RepID=UPI000A172011|nr:hypothetical protein [Clostridium botulinum]MBN1062370.1 hypothetical protein [Clostridium botulinum]